MTDFNPYREWLGFQGTGAPSDFYEMLGLSPFETDRDVIASALDQRTNTVRKIRPGEQIEQWQKLLDELGTVRQWLLDDDQKQQYDAQLRSQQTENAATTGNAATGNAATANGPAGAATPAGTNPLPPGVNPLPPGVNPSPPSPAGEADLPMASLGPIPSLSLMPEPAATLQPSAIPEPTVSAAQAGAGDATPQIPIASQGMGTPAAPQQPLAPAGYVAPATGYPQQPMLPQQPGYGVAQPGPIDPALLQQPPNQMMPNQMAPSPATPVPLANGMLPENAPPTGVAMGAAVRSAAMADPLASPTSDGSNGGDSPEQDGGSRMSYTTKSRDRAKGNGLMIGVIAAVLIIPLGGTAMYLARKTTTDDPGRTLANNAPGESSPSSRSEQPNKPQQRPAPNRPLDVPSQALKQPAVASPAGSDGDIPRPAAAVDPALPKPDKANPAAAVPNETKPNETKPNETKPNETKPNENEPAQVEPPAPPRELSATELANMQRALKAARKALGDRKLDEATVQIDVAFGIAATATQKAGAERMKLLHHYVSEFWRAVGESIKGLKGGEQLTINTIIAVVVEATDDLITIRAGGKNLVYEKMALPAGLAMVLADRWLDKSDPVTKVIRGAYLAVEPKADPDSARKYWKAAAASGVKDAEILLGLLDAADAADAAVMAVDPNAPRSRAAARGPSAGDIPRMIKALADARKALGQRNLEFSKGRLELAAKIATSPEHKALVERTKTLHHYVEQFWGAVADSLKDFDDVDELMVGSTRVAVVEASADAITIRAAGRNLTYKRMQIPTGLAIVIADRWLSDTDTTSKLIKAALLIVDPNAEPESALRLLQEAEVSGADVDELRLTLEDKLDPDDPPKSKAVARQGPLPQSAKIIAATSVVKKDFVANYRSAKTREDRYKLAKTLMDEANSQQGDEAYRYALFNEARNIAAKAHLPQLLVQIVDETVRWFAIDLLATKADALIQSAVRTSGTTAREVTFEILQVIDQALDADRTDVAVRLARVALGTARNSRDRDLMKRAAGKSEEIQSLLKEKNANKKNPKKPKGEPTLE